MTRMVSIDPGVTTGVAVWEIDLPDCCGELVETLEGHKWEPVLGVVPSADVVVLEYISLRDPRGWHLREAIEVSGVVKFLVQKELVEQPPALRAGPRRWTSFTHPSEHVRDAVHHGIAYLKREGLSWKCT